MAAIEPVFKIGQVVVTITPTNTHTLFSYSVAGGMTASGGAIMTTNTDTTLGWKLPNGFSDTNDGGSGCYCLHLVLDTALLSYQSASILRSNSEDPSMYFDTNRGLYVVENWNQRITRFLPITSEQWTGKIRIIYLTDRTGVNGLLSADGPNISSVVAARSNTWLTFGHGQGGDSTGSGNYVTVQFTRAVVQADFWWKLSGQMPPLSAPPNIIRLPDNWTSDMG